MAPEVHLLRVQQLQLVLSKVQQATKSDNMQQEQQSIQAGRRQVQAKVGPKLRSGLMQVQQQRPHDSGLWPTSAPLHLVS